jgi:hypothetical protein
MQEFWRDASLLTIIINIFKKIDSFLTDGEKDENFIFSFYNFILIFIKKKIEDIIKIVNLNFPNIFLDETNLILSNGFEGKFFHSNDRLINLKNTEEINLKYFKNFLNYEFFSREYDKKYKYPHKNKMGYQIITAIDCIKNETGSQISFLCGTENNFWDNNLILEVKQNPEKNSSRLFPILPKMFPNDAENKILILLKIYFSNKVVKI